MDPSKTDSAASVSRAYQCHRRDPLGPLLALGILGRRIFRRHCRESARAPALLWASCGGCTRLPIGHAGQPIVNRAFHARESARAPALLWASCGGCTRLPIGHAGQPIVNRAFHAGYCPIPGHGSNVACLVGRSCPPPSASLCGDHECKHLSHSTRGVQRVHHGVYPRWRR
jgi:hypothetical protein